MVEHRATGNSSESTEAKGVYANIGIAWMVFALFGISMLFSLGGTLSLAASSLGVWGSVVSLLRWQQHSLSAKNVEKLPAFYLVGQWLKIAAGVVLIASIWIFFLPGPLAAESIGLVQSKAVVWVLIATGGYFFIFQTRAAAAGRDCSRSVAWMVLLVFGSSVTAIGLLGAIYVERAAASAAGLLLVFVLVLLAVETFLRGLFFWFSPLRLRQGGPLVCDSLLLWWLMPGSGVGIEFLRRFEDLTGTSLREVHAIRFLGRALLPGLALILFLLWLSTSLTVVPFGHQGVRSIFGRFEGNALDPGLHLSLPAPVGKIVTVHTGGIRQESIGFSSDLLLPVLWNEKHLEGEENFLLGNGDEMLTINMPILYRVSDPVRFLLGAREPAEALRGLAQRELLLAMTGRPVFELISGERPDVMNAVWQKLQSECDRLGLGVEIVFVGLKDMHPPVQVADAYQAVSAAEDEQAALVERARAYRVDQIAGSAEDAFRRKRLADLRAWERELAVQAEVNALGALAKEDMSGRRGSKASAELLRFRLWHETLASALRGREKFLLPPGGDPELFLDYRRDLSNQPFQ